MAINPVVPLVHKWGPPQVRDPVVPARPGSLRGSLGVLARRLRRNAAQLEANGVALDKRLKKLGQRLGRPLDRIATGILEAEPGTMPVPLEHIPGPLKPVFEALRDGNSDARRTNEQLRKLRTSLDMALMQKLGAKDLLLVDRVYAQFRELHPLDLERQRELRTREVAIIGAQLRRALDEMNAGNGSTP